MRRLACLIVMLIAAGCTGEKTPEQPPLPAPAAGRVAFRASQEAFQRTPRFTLDRVSRTALGVFTETSQIDCAAPYLHWQRTKDLTAKGIADGTTTYQGPPRAHSEEERLFVFGQSFDRLTGDWENPPPAENNEKAWGPSRNSFDPGEECRAMRDGRRRHSFRTRRS